MGGLYVGTAIAGWLTEGRLEQAAYRGVLLVCIPGSTEEGEVGCEEPL